MIRKVLLALLSVTVISFSSCYKKDIQFGSSLGETFINLSNVDTVAVSMSTVILDSFPTNNPSTLLIGNCRDPYLGFITAKPFFQLALPTDVTLETNAVYDSLSFIVKPNGYYFGDTTRSHTLQVNELDQVLYYTYGTQLFNTSSFATKATPLGSKTLRLIPSRDSIQIRLSDAKGQELFNKLKTSATEITSATEFLNYFKGISLSMGPNDSSLIYGVNTIADSLKMRLYYHITFPYPTSRYKDFAVSKNDLAFNQLITNRKGTQLQTSGTTGITGLTEYPSTSTGNQSFFQSGAGVLLKLTFPSLRNILQLSNTVKLINATLNLRVPAATYDAYKFKLPAPLYLAHTDASNSLGAELSNVTGTGLLTSYPQVDYIYNTTATYSFDVTTSVTTLLNTAGSSASGFYVLQTNPGTLSTINRLIANDSKHGTTSSQLILYVLTVKNN